MADNIDWKGDDFLRNIEKGLAKNLKRACIHLTNKVKDAIGVGVTITKGQPGRNAKGKFTAGSVSVQRSKPGEPPRLEDGELRRSMAWEVDDSSLIGRVGTNKIYGKYLELGTKKMAKRPFLRPTLAKEQKAIRHIMNKKVE